MVVLATTIRLEQIYEAVAEAPDLEVKEPIPNKSKPKSEY